MRLSLVQHIRERYAIKLNFLNGLDSSFENFSFPYISLFFSSSFLATKDIEFNRLSMINARSFLLYFAH